MHDLQADIPPRPVREPCPRCGRPFDDEAVVCVHCGFSRRKGFRSAGGEHAPVPCAKCGYDLTGVTASRCPECGAGTIRVRRSLLDDDETRRRAFARPAIALAIGLAAIIALVLFRAGLKELALQLIACAASIPAAFVGLLAAERIWDIDDAPWNLSLLRAAGVTALLQPAAILLVPVSRFSFVASVRIAVFIVLATAAVMWVFDEDDYQDAATAAAPLAAAAAVIAPLVVWFIR